MRVSQFPADRRLADVKRCAAVLEKLHGDAANGFWRTEMIDFVAAMRSTGAGDEEIRRQAGLFLKAVQAELEQSFDRETHAGR